MELLDDEVAPPADFGDWKSVKSPELLIDGLLSFLQVFYVRNDTPS